MLQGRKTKLAILATVGLLLGLGAVAPVFAEAVAAVSATHFDTVTTCPSPTGCNLATTTQVVDTAHLCVSEGGTGVVCTEEYAAIVTSSECSDISTGTSVGTLCFQVYKVGTQGSCAADYKVTDGTPVITGTEVTSGISPISIVVPGSALNTGFHSYISTLTLSSSLTAGNYMWIVTFVGRGFTSLQKCEDFTLTGVFPVPPTGVPQFPLGMALLLALAIPALLLVRSKYASRISSSPI